MENNELFQRIKANDQEAFRELTDKYGWKVYSRIRKSTEDREKADLIFKKAFADFFESMKDSDTEDVIEAMLCVYAAMAADDIEKAEADNKKEGTPETAVTGLPEVTEAPKKKKRSFFSRLLYTLNVLLLVAGIVIALWAMAGLLMSLDILPELDLGYSWFNANIANWF